MSGYYSTSGVVSSILYSMPGVKFSHWLHRQLVRREMTPAEFSRKVGVSSGRVSEWITGKRIPSPKSCERIAEALLLDTDEVLEAAGHRPPSYDIPAGDPRYEIISMIRRLDPDDPTTRFWLESLVPTIERLRKLDKRAGRSE